MMIKMISLGCSRAIRPKTYSMKKLERVPFRTVQLVIEIQSFLVHDQRLLYLPLFHH